MYEVLDCQVCWRTWQRRVVRGRKPSMCPTCKPAPVATRRRAVTVRGNVPIAKAVMYTDGGKDGAGFWNERSDCTVRALATATGASYRDAHSFMARNGRRPGRGAHFYGIVHKNRDNLLGYRFEWVPMAISRGINAAMKRNPVLRKGTWILQQKSHVVTLKDGVLYDSFDSSRKEVRGAWKVTPV